MVAVTTCWAEFTGGAKLLFGGMLSAREPPLNVLSPRPLFSVQNVEPYSVHETVTFPPSITPGWVTLIEGQPPGGGYRPVLGASPGHTLVPNGPGGAGTVWGPIGGQATGSGLPVLGE